MSLSIYILFFIQVQTKKCKQQVDFVGRRNSSDLIEIKAVAWFYDNNKYAYEMRNNKYVYDWWWPHRLIKPQAVSSTDDDTERCQKK